MANCSLLRPPTGLQIAWKASLLRAEIVVRESVLTVSARLALPNAPANAVRFEIAVVEIFPGNRKNTIDNVNNTVSEIDILK